MELNGATAWKWTGPTVQTGLVAAIGAPIWSSGSYGNAPAAGAAVGSYRLLAGVGYAPASNIANAAPFVSNPPVAVAPASYNHTESAANGEVRVAYGAGMSEWCANCHTNIHMEGYVSGAMGSSGLKHPAGSGAILKPGQYDVYNTYVSSGVYTSAATDHYTSLVPFENAAKIGYTGAGGNLADIANLKLAANGADAVGIFTASGTSNVMCLSCHRAHASGFSSMVRWNADDTFITLNAVFADTLAGGRGQVALSNAYYGRAVGSGAGTLGNYQRSLCNKCHGKD